MLPHNSTPRSDPWGWPPRAVITPVGRLEFQDPDGRNWARTGGGALAASTWKPTSPKVHMVDARESWSKAPEESTICVPLESLHAGWLRWAGASVKVRCHRPGTPSGNIIRGLSERTDNDVISGPQPASAVRCHRVQAFDSEPSRFGFLVVEPGHMDDSCSGDPSSPRRSARVRARPPGGGCSVCGTMLTGLPAASLEAHGPVRPVDVRSADVPGQADHGHRRSSEHASP